MKRESELFVQYHFQLHLVATLLEKDMQMIALVETGRLCGLGYALNISEQRILRDLQLAMEVRKC